VLSAPVCIGKSCGIFTLDDLESDGILDQLSTALTGNVLITTCELGSANAPTPSPTSATTTQSTLLATITTAISLGFVAWHL
jgi:hypothetical protein